MKLVQRALLGFKEGTSDKVYEVDLCEVGDDAFVVNFRYGRRGSTLRVGSKTVEPVTRTRADAIFSSLVASKVKKGYQHAGATDAAPSPDGGDEGSPGASGAREQTIVDRLEVGAETGWPLNRAIWRAGELRIRAAEPHLLAILARDCDSRRKYNLAWALGRCGSGAAIPALEELHERDAESAATRRIAGEAIRSLADSPRRERYVDALRRALPATLARASAPADFTDALAERISLNPERGGEALLTAYLIDDDIVRPGVLTALRTAPVIDCFTALRAIFKVAEYRHDAEAFGILAHRVETTPANRNVEWNEDRYRWEARPFGKPTRDFLRRRVWRRLRRLGADRDVDFIKMAVGVLLPFTDADADAPLQRRYYSWNGPDRILRWDSYGRYWALSQLLYRHSPRYHADPAGRMFRCRDGYKPGDPQPATREEAFPERWSEAPAGLLHLLDGSRCEPVHHFAVKALRSCADFLAELDVDATLMLLGSPYQVTAELGFECAERLYDATEPNHDLVRAVLTCADPRARSRAHQWIESQRLRFIADSAMMAAAITSIHADNRAFAKRLLRASAASNDDIRLIIGRVVAALADCSDGERARDIGEILLACFAAPLRSIGIQVIRDLLAHALVEVQELAGTILLGHAELAHTTPDDIILDLLASAHESIRSLGARLLGQLSRRALRERKELLVHLTTHEHAELRESIRPAVAELIRGSRDFARDLARRFAEALLHKNPEGVPAHLLSLLVGELRDHLTDLPAEQVLRLLHARSPYAQELGGTLLASNVSVDELSITDMIKLVDHHILAVRAGAREMCENNLDRLRLAMNGSIRLLDSRWADSREWAFTLFRTSFTRAELTPAVLVGICDSVRTDVQEFGRGLITEHFADDDGQEYLLRLSEHPAETLQLFASNYLTRYASRDPERLAELEPYFERVLSGVNRGRVAKLRSIAFLADEARHSRAAAEIAARIFARQSVTIAVTYKAALIESLLAIHRTYPDLDVPVAIAPVEARGGV